MSDTITVRAAGICHAVACAPKGTKIANVLREANSQLPTGVGPWQKAKRRKLDDGTKLPAPCLDDPNRRHWLLEC